MGVGELFWIWKWLPLCPTATPRYKFEMEWSVGWEVSGFLPVAVLDVVAAPVEGGGPTLPLWGRVVTWMIVSCVWVVCRGFLLLF